MYLDTDGVSIRDPEAIARIRSLAIPPAWTEVWICPDPRGHIQAVGRDARRRKQFRYHSAWRTERDGLKFGRMDVFGRCLPKIRRRVERDLRRPGLSREKVLATVVQLLDDTAMRIGNEGYAHSNKSFGLTTLRNRHVTVTGSSLRFQFRGKGGKIHVVGVQDRRLSRIVSRCEALPGQDLFQYLDEAGQARPIESADVNGYLREASGEDVTAKDFRTWTGTLVAFSVLRRRPAPSAAEHPRSILRLSTESVAETLGNTAAVSRKSYIAPVVIDAYLAGALPRGRPVAEADVGQAHPSGRREELALVRLLERRPPQLRRSARRGSVRA